MSRVFQLTFIGALCLVLHNVAFATDAKEMASSWSKKSGVVKNGGASVRGQRSASRFKSGPAPGSWYYIMGHGHDTKRAFEEREAFDSARSLSSPLFALPQTGNPRRVSLLSGMTSRLASSPQQFAIRPLSANRQPTVSGGNGDAVGPENADALSTLFQPFSRTLPIETTKNSDSGEQTLLSEFLEFLVLKERNLLSRCLSSKDKTIN